MNRIFGFFREKLIEAKEQNQTQIQNIINAIEFQTYSQTKMLNYLQQIKTNYLEWNIMIANQASTGLYYTQIHNKTAIFKKIKANKESHQKKDKLEIVLGQMRKTLKELQSIEKLNYQWTNNMNDRMHKLSQILDKEKSDHKSKIQQKPQQNSTSNQNSAQIPPEIPESKQQKQGQQRNQSVQTEPSLI